MATALAGHGSDLIGSRQAVRATGAGAGHGERVAADGASVAIEAASTTVLGAATARRRGA